MVFARHQGPRLVSPILAVVLILRQEISEAMASQSGAPWRARAARSYSTPRSLLHTAIYILSDRSGDI